MDSRKLKEYLNKYYYDQNYNCAESLLRAANEAWDLGIEDRDMILMAGYGAGMQTGSTCGAVLAAIGVLSLRYVKEKAHESPEIRPRVVLFTEAFQRAMNGSTFCHDIKPAYFQPESRCIAVVQAACDALETAVSEPIVSVETMRASDAWTIEHEVSSKELMLRAGRAIFEQVAWKAPVAILCGKGNNAGDGYVAASLLKKAGIDCTVILTSDEFSEDGAYYYQQCLEEGVRTESWKDHMDLSSYGTILDCLLGTGFRGEVQGTLKEVIKAINESGAYVVSADINSGLNGDTGEGEVFVRSDLTVSIGFYKYGHFQGKAQEAIRERINCDIGIRRVPAV